MNKTHTIVLYALVIFCLLAVFWVGFQLRPPQESKWVCSNVVCTASVDGQTWAQNNCFFTSADDGSQTEVCRVIVDGSNQLVPRASLNITGLSQCIEYSCIQEVNVRAVNYTLNLTQ